MRSRHVRFSLKYSDYSELGPLLTLDPLDLLSSIQRSKIIEPQYTRIGFWVFLLQV